MALAMVAAAAVCFWLALLFELAAVSFLTFWGIRWQLPELRSVRDWLGEYSWRDGCLDVWLQSVLHCLVLAVYMPCLASRIRKRVLALRTQKRANSFVRAVTSVCQASHLLWCRAY